ncbi:MAG: hypothetical protein ACK4FE_15650 [Azonexus sp.]
MSRPIYTGPLDDARRAFWRERRQGRAGGTLVRLSAPAGQLLWGHSAANTWVALGFALVVAAAGWWFGGRRFDPGLWPLWLLAAVFALVVLFNLAYRESFTLDTLARRWHYRRGWGGAIRHETDAFDGEYGLAGLCLKEFRRPMPNRDSVWVLRLEFADGVRFVDLGGIRFAAQFDAARTEAETVTKATGLPLTLQPLEEIPSAP